MTFLRLTARRQKSLATLARASKQHRGVSAARQAAIRATHLLLQAEVAAQTKRQMAERKSTRRSTVPDLFQGLH